MARKRNNRKTIGRSRNPRPLPQQSLSHKPCSGYLPISTVGLTWLYFKFENLQGTDSYPNQEPHLPAYRLFDTMFGFTTGPGAYSDPCNFYWYHDNATGGNANAYDPYVSDVEIPNGGGIQISVTWSSGCGPGPSEFNFDWGSYNNNVTEIMKIPSGAPPNPGADWIKVCQHPSSLEGWNRGGRLKSITGKSRNNKYEQGRVGSKKMQSGGTTPSPNNGCRMFNSKFDCDSAQNCYWNFDDNCCH